VAEAVIAAIAAACVRRRIRFLQSVVLEIMARTEV
jgi:hypothetical protein